MLKLSYYTLSKSVSERGVQVAKLCMSYVNFELCEGKGNIVKFGPPYWGVEVKKLARKKGGSERWGFVTLLS